jgi:hypothetical protein
MLLRECVEDLDRVIADGEQRHAVGAESRRYILQLDQLRSTERSPVGAAVEDHEGFTLPAHRVDIN